MADEDWLSAFDAGQLLGLTPDGVRGLRMKGTLTHFREETHAANGQPAFRYQRAEVMALVEARGGRADTHPSPAAMTALGALVALGGKVESSSGRAASVLLDASTDPTYSSSSVGVALRQLHARGLVTRQTDSKRTYGVELTSQGTAWVRQHMDLLDPYLPKAKPPPAPEPDPPTPDIQATTEAERDTVALAVQAWDQPVVAAPHSNGDSPPGVREDSINITDLAHALLRQTTRVLADADMAPLMAERDALRVHNDVLVRRIDELSLRAESAEAENRELRGFLHQLEAQLTPMLAGQDARFNWLDIQTRTDLLRLLGEAAKWATRS